MDCDSCSRSHPACRLLLFGLHVLPLFPLLLRLLYRLNLIDPHLQNAMTALIQAMTAQFQHAVPAWNGDARMANGDSGYVFMRLESIV